MSQYFNKTYGDLFGINPPARTTVDVSQAGRTD